MSILIAVSDQQIGDDLIHTTNARDLHQYLQVGRDFTNWIKGRIESYGFTENVDYVVVQKLSSPNPASSKSRPQRLTEYHISLDMAKDLAMIENSDKGREVRRYFIRLERRHNKELEAAVAARAAESVRIDPREHIDLLRRFSELQERHFTLLSKPKPTRPAPLPLTKEEKQRVLELSARGLQSGEIAAAVKRSRSAIRAVIREIAAAVKRSRSAIRAVIRENDESRKVTP